MTQSLDKLISAIREAQESADEATREATLAKERYVEASAAVNVAQRRCSVLDQTLQKVVYENMTVEQAKMIAHEEAEAPNGHTGNGHLLGTQRGYQRKSP